MMKEIISRIKNIRLLALDVDGILTNCQISLDSTGEWRRSFSLRDGYGIKMLVDSGYQTAFITASKAKDIQERAKVLNITYSHMGNLDKATELKKLLEVSKLSPEQVAYMGDDIFDIPVLKSVGFAATVPEASPQVHSYVHYVTKAAGGHGAVREVCDLISQYGPRGSKLWDSHFQ
jgi:3-deoxy-D-manno-octulosonate 8-phosphate phosphatase (KDO 8-P phosphatase)